MSAIDYDNMSRIEAIRALKIANDELMTKEELSFVLDNSDINPHGLTWEMIENDSNPGNSFEDGKIYYYQLIDAISEYNMLKSGGIKYTVINLGR